MAIKVIITGATGMVGEGVLLHCLNNPEVEKVLIVNRRHYDLEHPKLTELLVPDFMKLSKVFTYVSGSHTDSTEKGSIMWARIKGRTENALFRLPYRKAYAFRPGVMKPVEGQKSLNKYFKYFAWLYPVVTLVAPKAVLTLHQVGQAMINCVTKGYNKPILEIADIRAAARK